MKVTPDFLFMNEPPPPRDAVERKGPQKRLDRRVEEVAKSVGGGYWDAKTCGFGLF